MILHLVNDEKIINRTMNLFETCFPGNNICVVITRKNCFKYIERKEYIFTKEEFLKLHKKESITTIVIHLLNTRKIKFLNQLKITNVPIYWIIWGADLYNRLLPMRGYPLFFSQNATFNKKALLKKLFFSPISYIQMQFRNYQTLHFIQKKVDYLVTDTTDNDYEVFLRYFPEMKDKKWKDFFYYPIDEILGDSLMTSTVKGDNIMLGNSGSLTNNHEYAMKCLSSLNIGHRKVVIPLSYGGKKEYVQTILKKGEVYFGSNFYPLVDFMPLEEYNKLQTTINVAIYGNWRQEAIGNIIIALYLGAKVFVSFKNPILEWANNHNLAIFELEKITQKELDEPLSTVIKDNNRRILVNLYNKRRLLQLIKETFSI